MPAGRSDRGRADAPTVMVLAVSLVLAAGIPIAWGATRPAIDAGTIPTATQAPDAPPSITDSPASPEREVVAPEPLADPPTARSARVEDLEQAGSSEPQRLRIPALAVDAPVIGVGVEPTGAMELPDDVGQVGWYRHGAAPGGAGVAVLAAHVDSLSQGPGVLFDLRHVEIGASIEISDDVGEVHEFEIVARRSYGKGELPTDELFARTGSPRLVLITCGGEFDVGTRSYRDNIVVHAVPRSAADSTRPSHSAEGMR